MKYIDLLTRMDNLGCRYMQKVQYLNAKGVLEIAREAVVRALGSNHSVAEKVSDNLDRIRAALTRVAGNTAEPSG